MRGWLLNLTLAFGLLLHAEASAETNHYDDAVECLAAGYFMFTIKRGPSALPDNEKTGQAVIELYLPIVAYEGTLKGMSQAEIVADVNARRELYTDAKIKMLNSLSLSQQNAAFNEIAEEVNVCARIPALRFIPE